MPKVTPCIAHPSECRTARLQPPPLKYRMPSNPSCLSRYPSTFAPVNSYEPHSNPLNWWHIVIMHYSRYSHIVGETEAQKCTVRRNTLGRVFTPGNGECNGLVRRSCNPPSNSQKEKVRVREGPSGGKGLAQWPPCLVKSSPFRPTSTLLHRVRSQGASVPMGGRERCSDSPPGELRSSSCSRSG